MGMLMRMILGGFWGVTGRMRFGGSGTGFGVSMEGANDGSILMEGELLDSCCTDFQKVMLPNTQSFEGL